VPTPVYVTVVPLTVAGPLTTLKIIGSPDGLALADSVAVVPGAAGEAGCVKLIVCAVVPAKRCRPTQPGRIRRLRLPLRFRSFRPP
jgi:hypothetical protein